MSWKSENGMILVKCMKWVYLYFRKHPCNHSLRGYTPTHEWGLWVWWYHYIYLEIQPHPQVEISSSSKSGCRPWCNDIWMRLNMRGLDFTQFQRTKLPFESFRSITALGRYSKKRFTHGDSAKRSGCCRCWVESAWYPLVMSK